jgi:class 3 adenylate cyclase
MKTTLTAVRVSEQIIAFVDLVGYHRHICAQITPEKAFEFLAEYYSIAQHASETSDARIVKFIGDSILLIFPPEETPTALATLRRVKAEVDGWLDQSGIDSRLRVKAHVGEVAAGPLGSSEFDVCGIAVNETALLPEGEWVLSDALRERTSA